MTQLDPHYALDEFDRPDFDAWRKKAEAMLRRPLADVATHVDGIDVPILRADDDRPGTRPLALGPGWTIVEPLDAVAPPEEVADAIEEAIAGGATVGWRTASTRVRLGLDAPAVPAPWLRSELPLAWRADAAAPQIYEAHVRADIEPAAVLSDPLGSLVELGARRRSLHEAYGRIASVTERVVGRGARTATALASGLPYHEAGLGPVAELGATIGAALSHLRGLEAHAVSVPQAAAHLWLQLGIGGDVFVEIAKLRAARRMWASVLRRAGAKPERVTIVARTGRRRMAAVDVSVNLLRHTTQAFAAVVGGADRIEIEPHRWPADAGVRRWARNVHHLLAGEAWLGHVADPAEGSATIEQLTEALVDAAWPIAVQLSGEDPEAALRDWLAGLPTPAPESEAKQVGVDLYPPKQPEWLPWPGSPEPPDVPDAVVAMTPLRPVRRAAGFEEALR